MKGRLITNPGWYARGIGKELTDLDVADSMNNYFARVMVTMELLASINEDAVVYEDVENVAAIVRDMTGEAKVLLDRWWEKNSARRDHTVEVEAIK